MMSSDNADAALQDEGHISARRGGHKSSLRGRMAKEKDVMNGRITMRMVVTPQINHRE